MEHKTALANAQEAARVADIFRGKNEELLQNARIIEDKLGAERDLSSALRKTLESTTEALHGEQRRASKLERALEVCGVLRHITAKTDQIYPMGSAALASIKFLGNHHVRHLQSLQRQLAETLVTHGDSQYDLINAQNEVNFQRRQLESLGHAVKGNTLTIEQLRLELSCREQDATIKEGYRTSRIQVHFMMNEIMNSMGHSGLHQ
jgi:hypothetical protein